MPIAAVPKYFGEAFSGASPGMRFGMYLALWGVNRRTQASLWTTHDLDYEVRGQQREEREVKHENKGNALNTAKQLNDNDKKTLTALLERHECLVMAFAYTGDSLCLDATATAPFTTGLGNEHPLENGFAFLNPYGLPYLPGSGVKGVLRQAARELADGEWGEAGGWSDKKAFILDTGQEKIPLSIIDVLFGFESSDGDTTHVRGALSFWDVIPRVKGDSLMVEIMTPHQKHYYQDGATPHDSGQPNPICFLTVPPGSAFRFIITCDVAHLRRLTAIRDDGSPDLLAEGDTHWKTLLKDAFQHAFQWLGFGAKTAVGYGAMEALSDEAVAQARREAEVARRKCSWVDQTIQLLANENHAKPDDILRGKLLAQAWSELTDPRLQENARADIQSRWEERDWWNEPPGKAARAARDIYERNNDQS